MDPSPHFKRESASSKRALGNFEWTEDYRKFPAAGNFAANFLAANGEFCRFCPKSADFDAAAGNGAGIYGNFTSIYFLIWDLPCLFSRSHTPAAGKQQGKSRELCTLTVRLGLRIASQTGLLSVDWHAICRIEKSKLVTREFRRSMSAPSCFLFLTNSTPCRLYRSSILVRSTG